jgi:hypothetical protein
MPWTTTATPIRGAHRVPSLTPLEPLVAAGLGGAVTLLPRLTKHTLTSVAWVLWAGLAGGFLASAAFSAEFLSTGTGGLVYCAIGGLAGGAVMTVSLVGVGGPGVWRSPAASIHEAGARKPSATQALLRRASSGSSWMIAVAVAVLAVLVALAGLGWLAVLVLLGLGAVGSTRFGWSLAAGFFVVTTLVSALYVLVAQFVLSPFDEVGRMVPAVLVVAVATLPLVAAACGAAAWKTVRRTVALPDLAAFALAATCGLTWWHLFHRLTSSQLVAQLVRLGEDNLSHMLMLGATRTTGDRLGSSDASRALAARFADYFPGSSTWQSGVGALTGASSTTQAYLVSTAVLLGLLAGLAGSVAGRAMSRPGGLAALGIFGVGVVASRATFAMYELGFPGQLMVACFVLAALHLCLMRRARLPRPVAMALLLLLALAAYWCWSLAAVVMGLPVVVLLFLEARRIPWWTPRRERIGLAVVALLALVAIAVKHALIVTILDELLLEGAVFRGVPIWVALGLVLALPLALGIRSRRVPRQATALVLGFGLALLVLYTWQVGRVGTMTYYGYKLEYFLLALGWGAGTLGAVAVGERVERTTGVVSRVAAAVIAVALVWPLATWPGPSYRSWLTARAVYGPDPAIACAVHAAQRAPKHSLAVAVGFGEPISNYIATRSMDVGLGGSYSANFWPAVLSLPDPSTWPWSSTTDRVLVVTGPVAAQAQAEKIVAAATTAGLRVRQISTCST